MKKTLKTFFCLFTCCLLISLLTGTAWADPGKKDKHIPPGQLKQQLKAYSFTDVENHWASDDIETVQQKGIMKGYEDKKFQPNKPVTKNEAIAVIMRVVNHQQAPEDKAKELKDLFPSWMGLAPVQAYDAGILEKWELANWNGNKPATRIEVAMWLSKAAGNKDTSVSALLSLKDTKELTKEQLAYAAVVYNKGIMKGTPEGYLNPNKPITRAEFASMMLRFVNGDAVTIPGDNKKNELISRLTPANKETVPLNTRDFEIKFTEKMTFVSGKSSSDLAKGVQLLEYVNNSWVETALSYAIVFTDGTNRLALRLSNGEELSSGTKYCITVRSGILETEQSDAKLFKGIAKGEWSFTTEKDLEELTVSQIKATDSTTIVIKFNREIEKGDSFKSSGAGVYVSRGNNELEIFKVEINKDRFTIKLDPDSSLQDKKSYKVWMDEDIIKDFELSEDEALDVTYKK